MSTSISHLLPIVLPRAPRSRATSTRALKSQSTATTASLHKDKATGAIPRLRQKNATRRPITVNLLPCGIKTAAQTVARGYWRPRLVRLGRKREGGSGCGGEGEGEGGDTAAVADTNNITLYESTFRGRRLLGRRVPVPDGYAGHIIALTPDVEMEVGVEAEERPSRNQLVELAQFDELLVWGHDQVPEEGSDPVVKSLSEWVAFAGRVNLVEG